MISLIFLQQEVFPGYDSLVIPILALLVLFSLAALFLSRKMYRDLERRNSLLKKQTAEVLNKNATLKNQIQSMRELNAEKNSIIGVVAHDLKAPLNRIFALSNLFYLSGDNLTEQQRDYIEKMNQVVKDGLDMIRNQLDIRAIEYKGVELNVEPLSLDELLANLIKSYSSTLEKKNQQVHFKNLGDEIHIISDKQYLNRIFDNILSNAVKYSPKGEKINVEVSSTPEKFTVRIMDNGQGVHPREVPKLFEKYRVLSARPTGGESSTGLGLSIAKSLVDILEGKIYYEQTGPKGATFVVELPKVRERDE